MKKLLQIISYIFMVLALVFIVFGIYEIVQSFHYVTTYSTQGASSGMTIFQYVLTSSMAYFGFGFVFLGIGAILLKQDKILSEQSAAKAADDAVPSTEPAEPAPEDTGKTDTEPSQKLQITSDFIKGLFEDK